MKKATPAILYASLAVLLGLTVYMTFLLFGSGALRQANSYTSDVQQNLRPGGGMGFGMMGPGMMESMGTFVNSEYDFLLHMIPHHEEAVFTAGILKENTEREEMKKFAEDIIKTQSEEIAQMTTWLAAWYPEKDHDIDYRPMMRELENLKGEELDLVFLEDMIPHHMEAVMMSQQLIFQSLAEHEEVLSLAINIRNNQRNEIHMMMNWMSQWYGNAQIAETSDGIMMMWIVLIAAAASIVTAVWLIRAVFSGSMSTVSSVNSAKELLDVRYAKGEISQEEYLDVRKNLET